MNIFINHQPPTTSYFSPYFLSKICSFIFLIIGSIFAVSCSEETLDIEPVKESSEILAKSATEDKVKLLELAQGLSPAIKQYNKYHKQENKFLKKYGYFDKENIFGVKLPQYSEDVMLVIPFTSKNLKKNKILIAYYKNGEKQYKIFSKKKFKEKKRERIEEGILIHLDFIFDMSENNTEGYQGKTVLNKYCDYLWSSTDASQCTTTYTNCRGEQRIVYNSDKMGGCGSDYGMEINANEVVLYAPPTPPVQYPTSPAPEDNDPDTRIDQECDYWDFECNESIGDGVSNVTINPCPPGKVKDANNNCVDLPCNTFEGRANDVLKTEGGFKNDPQDKNDPTNRGISTPTWKTYAKSVLGIEPTINALKNLTEDQAKAIYKKIYWESIKLDLINDGDLRYLLFDSGVHSGPKMAVKQLQKVLNSMGYTLAVDGTMGTNTLNTINLANQMELYNRFKQYRINFLTELCTKGSASYRNKYELYLNGFMNRIDSFKSKTTTESVNVNCN